MNLSVYIHLKEVWRRWICENDSMKTTVCIINIHECFPIGWQDQILSRASVRATTFLVCSLTTTTTIPSLLRFGFNTHVPPKLLVTLFDDLVRCHECSISLISCILITLRLVTGISSKMVSIRAQSKRDHGHHRYYLQFVLVEDNVCSLLILAADHSHAHPLMSCTDTILLLRFLIRSSNRHSRSWTR